MKTAFIEACLRAQRKVRPRAEPEMETVDASGWIESTTGYAVLFRPGVRDRFGVHVKHIWIPYEELKGQKPPVWFRVLHFATLTGVALEPFYPLSHPARLTIRKDRWLDAAPKPTFR